MTAFFAVSLNEDSFRRYAIKFGGVATESTRHAMNEGLAKLSRNLPWMNPRLTGRSAASWIAAHQASGIFSWMGQPPPHLTPSGIDDAPNPDYPDRSTVEAWLRSGSYIDRGKKLRAVFYNPLNYLYHLNEGTHRYAGIKYMGWVSRAIRFAFPLKEFKGDVMKGMRNGLS